MIGDKPLRSKIIQYIYSYFNQELGDNWLEIEVDWNGRRSDVKMKGDLEFQVGCSIRPSLRGCNKLPHIFWPGHLKRGQKFDNV